VNLGIWDDVLRLIGLNHESVSMHKLNQLWIDSVRTSVAGYRNVIDSAIRQLSDEEFFAIPADGVNSAAVVIRHLAGNLTSRWTDYLTTDGEKPNRHRDTEFDAWDGDRASLMEYFESGWQCLIDAIDSLDDDTVTQTIQIRGEDHSVPEAMTRSVNHLAYHVGQIMVIARMVHTGEWKWLTIAPGASDDHNKRTWGTSAARSAYGQSGPGQ